MVKNNTENTKEEITQFYSHKRGSEIIQNSKNQKISIKENVTKIGEHYNLSQLQAIITLKECNTEFSENLILSKVVGMFKDNRYLESEKDENGQCKYRLFLHNLFHSINDFKHTRRYIQIS